MPNFSEYDRSRDRANREAPSVTVLHNAAIAFNKAAMAALGNPGAVAFLIDEDERLLGFCATGIVKRNRRPRAVGNGAIVRGPGTMVSATRVLRHLGVDLGQSRRYPLVMLDGTYCIDLKKPGTVVTSNRRKTPA